VADSSSFFRWLVGREPGGDEKVVFQWANLPESWKIFVFIAVVGFLAYAVVWLYRREMESCPRAVKRSLAVVRLLVLAVLVLMFLQPSLSTLTVSRRLPNIALLRDISQSMDRTDSYRIAEDAKKLGDALGEGVSQIQSTKWNRADLVQQLISRNSNEFVNALRVKGSVQVYDFSSDVRKVGTLAAIGNVTANASQLNAKQGTGEEEDSTKSKEINEMPR
jgi:hypothetical protein